MVIMLCTCLCRHIIPHELHLQNFIVGFVHEAPVSAAKVAWGSAMSTLVSGRCMRHLYSLLGRHVSRDQYNAPWYITFCSRIKLKCDSSPRGRETFIRLVFNSPAVDVVSIFVLSGGQSSFRCRGVAPCTRNCLISLYSLPYGGLVRYTMFSKVWLLL